MKLWWIALACAVWLALPAQALDEVHHYNDTKSAGPKILFVGNSLTFFHSLPNTVANFTKSRVGDVVAPGYTLEQHWNDQIAQKEFSAEPWDVIVLQGKSTEFNEPGKFLKHGHLFGNTIAAKSKAKIVLYETFANDGKPDDQPKIRQMYDRLGKDLHAEVIPVGDVFYFVHKEDPSIKLWVEDKLHPTAEGTYLAACVFFEYLTKSSPVGLPNQITGDEPWSVTPEVANRLQELAWKFYRTRQAAKR